MTTPGQDTHSAYSRHVRARVSDFARDKTPWQRRLWNVGSMYALEELHEAATWVDEGVLRPKAAAWLRESASRTLGRDSALGTAVFRSQLTRCLSSDLTLHSDGRRRLRDLIDLAGAGYLDRLAEQAALPQPPGPERVARAFASHMLDLGYSMSGLDAWLRSRDHLSAVELIGQGAQWTREPEQTFSVFAPILKLPDKPELAFTNNSWRERGALAPEAMAKLSEASIVGAFEWRVTARDAASAAGLAAERVSRLEARVTLGRPGDAVSFAQRLWVNGHGAVDRRVASRGAVLMSLATEGQLFEIGHDRGPNATGWRRDIDDALELAAGLNHGPITPAVAGAWAALESLLAISQDSDESEGHVSAARRAAALVACSWPRAELTALSYRVATGKSKALDESLTASESNRDRAEVIQAHIKKHGGIPIDRGWRLSSDSAAVQRMKGLIENPRPVLKDVHDYAESALRRLYRHRNIILHGGAPSDRSTGPGLRLAAPLVGAALDRITHAAFLRQVAPLELAAQAEVALNLAGDAMGRDICALLE